MFRPFLIALFFVSSIFVLADDTLIPPLKAIEQFGSISVSDGSSYYMFAKDGSFQSGPLGQSGRTMTGRWSKDADGRLVATAKLGWINGISSKDQYRRIVFFISHVSNRAVEPNPNPFFHRVPFDSYFFIDEMTVIPKPEKDFPK